MGQEKSVPIRCNTCHNYSSAIKASAPLSQPPATVNRQPSTQPAHKTAPSPVVRSPSHHHRHHHTSTAKSTKSTKTACPSSHYKPSHTRSASLSTTLCPDHTVTRSLYKVARDTKATAYLDQQLHIKSYLDADDETDRSEPLQFRPAKNGIRNYTPKILLEQSTSTTSESASSTSSNEHEDIDIWI